MVTFSNCLNDNIFIWILWIVCKMTLIRYTTLKLFKYLWFCIKFRPVILHNFSFMSWVFINILTFSMLESRCIHFDLLSSWIICQELDVTGSHYLVNAVEMELGFIKFAAKKLLVSESFPTNFLKTSKHFQFVVIFNLVTNNLEKRWNHWLRFVTREKYSYHLL